VLYYQADEIWHEDLVKLTKKELDYQTQYLQCEELDYSFWRYQLKYNFQRIKQFPQVVHRIGSKAKFNFVVDGMNSDRHFEPKMISTWGKEHFMQWGDRHKYSSNKLPTNEMILDVGLIGAFLDNIPDRRRMHLPFWHEGEVMPVDEGEVLSIDNWYCKHQDNQEWDLHSTPFNIPEIMRFHLGRRTYVLREQLFNALKDGDSWRQ
jgi:hypothetical protein